MRVFNLRTVLLFFVLLLLVNQAHAQAQEGTVIVTVRDGTGKPIEDAEVQANNTTSRTDPRGEVTLRLPAAAAQLRIQRSGFKPASLSIAVRLAETDRVSVALELDAEVEESIVVTATRNDTLLEDEPLRVEIVGREEVEEKATMTPGDVAMLLNETSGLRVQVTSPALGTANVRVQGLRGRYTQVLSDGLPLYGQVGSIGILQIPPLDLGQVEVIKGVASALYGSSALGGVINLVSRRPGKEPERQVLLNATSRKGTDAVFWLTEPPKNHWGYSMLVGAHFQEQSDIDDDAWADMPEYQRGVLRPRWFWEDGTGKSLFLTTGVMVEDRAGGSASFREELRTRRADSGVVGRLPVGNKLISIRGSAMTQRHRRQFGDTLERDRQDTYFGETAMSGAKDKHSWTIGAALQIDTYRSRDVERFDYTYTVPAMFAQDEYKANSRVTVAASGRVDFHNEYGALFNPRVSALIRLPRGLTARVSTGTGAFAPTPFTEETEATGLTRVQSLQNIKAERAWSSSADLAWKKNGWLELNATVFGSRIRNAAGLTRDLEIVNATEPTRTAGSEFYVRLRRKPFTVVMTHTFVHSTEFDLKDGQRRIVPLTPKHTAGIDLMLEKEGRGRIGIEAFYTGRQQLEDNPYRTESIPYWVFGILLERQFGRVRVFLNAEDLGNFRQTRYEPLVRPTSNFDGRMTVDAWAPLEGRVINGGIRFGL